MTRTAILLCVLMAGCADTAPAIKAMAKLKAPLVQRQPIAHVTTLEDYDPNREARLAGSLRDLAERVPPGTRIMFDVGGDIRLKTKLVIPRIDIAIDGTGSPWPGVTILRHQVELDNAAGVSLVNLRLRACDGFANDAERTAVQGNLGWHDPSVCGWRSLLISDSHHISIINCSIEDSCDDNANVWNDCHDILFDSCIFAGGYCMGSGQGLLVGTEPGKPDCNYPGYVTIRRCLFAGLQCRTPDLHGGVIQFINNVIAHPVQGGRFVNFRGNVSGNWIINLRPHPKSSPEMAMTTLDSSGNIYAVDNWIDGVNVVNPFGVTNGGQVPAPSAAYRATPFRGLPQVVPAQKVPADVFANAGAMPRDVVDAGIVDQAAR